MNLFPLCPLPNFHSSFWINQTSCDSYHGYHIPTITAPTKQQANNRNTITMSNSSFLPQCTGHPDRMTSIPDIKGIETIPQNINVVMVGASNDTLQAMTSCCAPHYVQVLDGCYLWCKLPGPEHVDNIHSNFTSCLDGNGMARTGRLIVGGNIPNAGERVGPAVTSVGLGLWGLVVVGVLMG